MKITIQGLQKAQDANNRLIAALKPSGAAGKATKAVLMGAHSRYVILTHVDTGALKAARRMKMDAQGLRGYIYTDPNAVNPKGKRPAEYDIYEQARGGSHAAADRLEAEHGRALRALGVQVLIGGLK